MLLKHNLVLLVVVQVTRSPKQFLQALFAQNMHLSGIEKTGVERDRKQLLTKFRKADLGLYE